MDAPKSTAAIRAAPDAFKAACTRAAVAFGGIAGIVSVGFGLKQTGGTFGDDLAIVVFVHAKKPEAALAPAERIPPLFEGYRTDVRTVPQCRLGACENTAKYATIQGGIQVANPGERVGNTINRAFGTLGCIVHRRNHSGNDNLYVLSNAHVMYAKGRGPGDMLSHPDAQNGSGLGPIMDGGAFHNIVWPPGTPPPNPLPDPAHPDADINHPNDAFVDCAIARLERDSCCGCTQDTVAFTPSVIDLVDVTPPGAGPADGVHAANRIADVRDAFNDTGMVGEILTKVGRTTGRTQGRCVNVTTPVHIVDAFDPSPNPGRIFAYNCIEIEPHPRGTLDCLGHAYFAEEGDSGSLIVDAQRRAVGLLFGVPDPHRVPPDPPNTSSCAVHIVPVLDHLGICIACLPGATGHGSSSAADGSGLAPHTLAPDQSHLGSTISWLGAGTAGWTAPVPRDDTQHQRMQALLAAFRATRDGRVLDAAIDSLRREIGYLVRNVRPVKVAWGRHQGPAWLAHILNHIAGHAATVPHAIKGMSRRALLEHMRDVLLVYGSNAMRDALMEHGDTVLDLLTMEGSDSLADVVAALQARDQARDQVPAVEGDA